LYNAITAIVPIIALSLVIIGISKYTKTPIKETVSLKKFSPVYLIPTLMIAVGMLLGAGFLNGLFSKLLQDLGVKLPESSLTISSTGEFILFTILVGVLPAVFEEVFFRGFMLNSLDGVKIFQTTLFVSICFAIYHCSLAQLLYQFIYGGFLCLLALSAKSTYPCIIAHFLNNFAVVLFTYLGVEINLFSPIPIVCGLLALAVMAWVIINDLKKRPRREQDKEERNGEKMAKTFKEKWIPMEEKYFSTFAIKEKADVLV
jgi:membrane protease YdiL (CAAX protease family)